MRCFAVNAQPGCNQRHATQTAYHAGNPPSTAPNHRCHELLEQIPSPSPLSAHVQGWPSALHYTHVLIDCILLIIDLVVVFLQPKRVALLLEGAMKPIHELAIVSAQHSRWLKYRNAILSAAGYNFRRILAWPRGLLCQILVAILRLGISQSALNPASSWTTNLMDDEFVRTVVLITLNLG
jgi:hypothetical protein